MASRNEPCPCGSGIKHKRCCLLRAAAVAQDYRRHDELLADALEWLRLEHEDLLHTALRVTRTTRLVRGRVGRSMGAVWAVSDHKPGDGGPPLLARFASRETASPEDTAYLTALLSARLDVYRVISVEPRLWIELAALRGGEPQRVGVTSAQDITPGDTLIARVIEGPTMPMCWGMSAHFDAAHPRRWRALLSALPAEREAAGLLLLGYHPDDAPEPIRDDIDTVKAAWRVVDADAACETVDDHDACECLGMNPDGGWAFAWLQDAGCGSPDLGGWEFDGEIEAARVVIDSTTVTLTAANDTTLTVAGAWLRDTLGELMALAPTQLAA